MKRFKLSAEAARDIRDIWAYIAQDSTKAARRVRLQIFEACQQISENPGIGRRREDLTDKPVLFWPVGSYLIIYRRAAKSVDIVRVLHGAIDIASRLDT